MLPVNLLWLRSSSRSHDKAPSSVGIVPVWAKYLQYSIENSEWIFRYSRKPLVNLSTLPYLRNDCGPSQSPPTPSAPPPPRGCCLHSPCEIQDSQINHFVTFVSNSYLLSQFFSVALSYGVRLGAIRFFFFVWKWIMQLVKVYVTVLLYHSIETYSMLV